MASCHPRPSGITVAMVTFAEARLQSHLARAALSDGAGDFVGRANRFAGRSEPGMPVGTVKSRTFTPCASYAMPSLTPNRHGRSRKYRPSRHTRMPDGADGTFQRKPI